jgi:predicted dehydrogenase
MKPVVWGVLSVSSHYRLRVSDGLSRSEQVRVKGIASRDEGRANAAAAEMGLQTGYGSYDALLADPEIEAVYIPLPNNLHLEWIKRAADAGKHILCEKPLGMNAAEVEEAIEYTRKKGVLMMEAFMYRFHPQWIRARQLVEIGEVGTPTAIQCNFFYDNQDPDNIRNRPETGGGAIMDIGCYAVSSARFLLGREPQRVVSLIQRDDRFGTDRLASGILDFGDVQATFTVGTQTGSAQGVQLFGTSGGIEVVLPFNAYPDVPLALRVHSGVGERTIDAGPSDQYVEQFEAFSRAVRQGGPVPTDPVDALNNQKVLDALFRSGKSGTWEEI